MLKKYEDVLVGIVLDLGAAVLFIASFGIKSMVKMSPGPAFFPRLGAVLLFLLGLGIIKEGIYASKLCQKDGRSKEELKETRNGYLRMVLNSLLLLIYILLLKPVGFLLATPFYMFIQMWLLAPVNKRKPVLFAAISIVTSVITYYAFVYGLNLMLPAGILW